MSAPTIFLSVAAYCDPMLRFTLNSARAQAADPSRIFIGIVEQQAAGQQLRLHDEWSREHLRWTRVDALEARGPCWARSLAMALYQGEDWYFQIDSHMWFEPGWDDKLIRWAERCCENNERSLLTCYPNAFTLKDGHPVAQPVTNSMLAFAATGETQFADDHPVLMFECRSNAASRWPACMSPAAASSRPASSSTTCRTTRTCTSTARSSRSRCAPGPMAGT